jgi:integrase
MELLEPLARLQEFKFLDGQLRDRLLAINPLDCWAPATLDFAVSHWPGRIRWSGIAHSDCKDYDDTSEEDKAEYVKRLNASAFRICLRHRSRFYHSPGLPLPVFDYTCDGWKYLLRLAVTMKPERINRLKGEGSLYRHTDGRWLYAIMHNGKRLIKSLGTRDEDEAKRNLAKVRNNFMGRIDRGELKTSDQANVKIRELVDDYIKHVKQNSHKSAGIIEGVLKKAMKAPEFDKRKVSTLETADFKSYRDRLTKSGISHSTVNNHLAYVRAALRLETKQTPSRVVKVPHIPIVRVNNARQGFLEYDNYETLLKHLPQSLKALFVIAFHSGCRLGEVLGMRWTDVDWKNRIVRLPDSKNGKARNLPFWGSIEEHLKKQKAYRDKHHPECEGLFFWMADDVQLAHGGVRNDPGTAIVDFRASWSNAVTEAHKKNSNVPDNLLFHDLRRSGVRVMVQDAAIPEAQAMLISGHETRSMLERYNIVSLKNVQDAGAKLDAWQKARSKRSKSKTAKKAGNVVSIRSKSRPNRSKRAKTA